MLDEGYITRAEATRRATRPGRHEPEPLTSVLREPQFSFRVRAEAERILAALDRASTTRGRGPHGWLSDHHDARLRAAAGGEAAGREVGRHAGRDFNVNNGALVAINSATGEIVAYVGSVDYYNREDPRVQGQFDVAGLGRRQPGSAFKPITYASAFQSRDATLSTMLVDAMTEFGLDAGDVVPPDECRHQGARPGACHRRAALLDEHPVGPDAVPGRLADHGELRAVARDRRRRLHHGPGSRPVPRPRLGAGQPDEHDAGVRGLREQGSCTRQPRSSRSATARTASSTPARTTVPRSRTR